MTLEEFLEELRLARLDMRPGVRAGLRRNLVPGRSSLLRVPLAPGSAACDCPVTFLARSMGLLDGCMDWNYRQHGKALGLNFLTLADIVAASDGHPALAHLRSRLCAALGIEDAAARQEHAA